MATLYSEEHVHIARTQTRIPTPYFCMEQESESEFILIFEPSNVFKPQCGKLVCKILGLINNVTTKKEPPVHWRA